MFAQVFGEKHLFGTGFILLVIFIFLLFIPKNTDIKIQIIYLKIFTALFLLIEFLRLVFLVVRDGSLAIYQLPLNLCSLPLYLYPILAFNFGNTKIKTWIMTRHFQP